MAKSQLSSLTHTGPVQALILVGVFIAFSIGIAPAKDAPKSLTVFPDQVSLETSSDFHKLVVLATYADGATRDVTSKTRFQCQDPGIAKIEGATLTAQKDGKTTISASFGGLESSVSVAVSGAAAARPISYNLDVMPLLMRHGCNTGSCHGTARGRDGFMLSLFGYDPNGDYHRITREMGARRVNIAVPEASLLLTKSIEAVPHTGGKLFEKDSDAYRQLLEWLRLGANRDPETIATVERIEVFPKQALLEGEGTTQQMSVRAFYSDGTDRDVTTLAVFFSSNDHSVDIDKNGLMRAGKRGEAYVMARFDVYTTGCEVLVFPEDFNYTSTERESSHYIDQLVYDKLERLRIPTSGICSDEVFLRRATIDLAGRTPTLEEYKVFIDDPSPAKREKLIDRHLAGEEFTNLWVMKFAEMLQIRSDTSLTGKGVIKYYRWLSRRVHANEPIDRIVADLLCAEGYTQENPPTNFFKTESDRLILSENIAQIFMGVRLQCAQCHNHPFDRWTMDDYYGYASFFQAFTIKQTANPMNQAVISGSRRLAKHPVTGQTVPARFPGGVEPKIEPGADPRELFAEWLVARDNAFFATNLSNRIWEHFFGIGIVDPVDDFRISNPASNQQLLDELAKRFAASGYDFRKLIREICTSHTYQRETQSRPENEHDETNFARSRMRRLRAEVLYDSLSFATDTVDQPLSVQSVGLGGSAAVSGAEFPCGMRVVQLPDGRYTNYFLSTFGRTNRERVDSDEVKMDSNLSQALHFINGTTIEKKIAKGNIVANALKAGETPEQIIEKLYIRAFSRRPTDEQKTHLLNIVGTNKNKWEQELNDIFWALLNTKEFIFNH